MKTYNRIKTLIASALGILSLLFMSSFTDYNACEYANDNSVYIKYQTQLAFEASEFKMVKYHAYKALTGIEKSKNNFKKCGCDAALESIDRTKTNLKSATKASSLYDAKEYVHIALKNTTIILLELEKYNQIYDTNFGTDFLTINTKSTVITDDIVKLEGKTLSEKINNGVAKFQESLDNMIAANDCDVALAYVQKTHELSERKTTDTNVSPGKRYYHKRIKEITYNAIEKLKNCK